MKTVRWIAPLLVLAALAAGCKGFWDLPAGSGTGTGTTPTTDSSGVFYVLNQTTKQIAGFKISSGTLDNISGSPYNLPAAPTSIAIDPVNGAFLYVGTINGIYLYSIASGGALTLANNSNPISDDIPAAMLISGSWLVDAFSTATNSPQIDAIPIDPSTGAYTGSGGAPPSQIFSSITNAAVKQMVLSQDGANLFVALGTGGSIVVPFTSSSNSNPLAATATTIPLANSGGGALSVAVDPTNRVFYIGETDVNGSGGLRVFNYSSLGTAVPRTTPTQITGSPIATGGLSPLAILPLSNGEYVYVANGQGNTTAGNVAWFPITASGTAYSIAAGKTIAAGVYPDGLAEDSSGNFVLAVASGGTTSSANPDLDAFTISSGVLTSAIQAKTGTDPVGAIAIAPLP
ncbi:MAG TPA: hypothetical protein VMT38_10805 [Terracidiphilus sp.]|nr:hypothetical protein [Terracidiphilus sp.]